MEKTKNKKYCVCVDGSIFSEYGLDLTLDEFFDSSKDVFVGLHIKQKNQSDLPFKMKSESIYSYIESKLITSLSKDKYFIQIIEEDNSKRHPIAQVYDCCVKLEYNYLIVGFQGTSKKQKNEITNGIKYLITNVHLPCFIIKDFTPRKEKKNKGYIWLACIDTHNSRGWKAFHEAINFIDNEKDTILCMHFNASKNEKELVEKCFLQECEEHKIKNKQFIIQEYNSSRSISDQIVDYVNHCQETPDFVILGHNSSKYSNYKLDVMISPAVGIMSKAYTNIMFYS